MNIKSLLLGSAAALAAVSGAQAADAIVAAQPEPVEYVRVCDAFGTGYFYIPGTETCLKIGGYVRTEIQLGGTGTYGSYTTNPAAGTIVNGAGVYPVAGQTDQKWDFAGRVQLDVTAKNDTELGTLTSVASLRWNYGDNNVWTGGGESVSINEAYAQLGGFKIGRYLNQWDKGINGETDTLASAITTRLNSIGYYYTGSALSAGVQVDELSRNSQNVGVEGIVTAKFGAIALDLLASWDFGADEGAVRALLSAPVGPGTLQAGLVWSSGLGDGWANGGTYRQAYYDRGEWALAASYAIKATDKLTFTPGAEYIWNTQVKSLTNGDWTGKDAWRAGLTVDYAVTSGLALKVTGNYNKVGYGNDYWDGFVRLDRTF